MSASCRTPVDSTVSSPAFVSISPRFLASLRALALAGLCLACAGGLTAKEKWDPVPKADLEAKDSVTNPGADIEFLLNRQAIRGAGSSAPLGHAGDEVEKIYVDHFIRAKVYTAKGAEDWGKFYAESDPGSVVLDLAGRVVKADGTVVEMSKSDFHQSTKVKYENEQWNETVFAFPNLAPGDVIEARWTQLYTRYLFVYQIYVQETFPVREFRFSVEKFPSEYWVEWQNCKGELANHNQSQMALVVRNLPAFQREEHMPAEWDFRGGLLLIRNTSFFKSNELWLEISRYYDDDFDTQSKPSREIREKARALTEGAATDDERLKRFYDFCQTEIVNLNTSESADAKAIKDKRSNDEHDSTQDAPTTFRKRIGWPTEINFLFASLARSAGYEAKRTESTSRNRVMNVNTPKGWGFFDHAAVAVKVGTGWRYCDPGSTWVPYGMLRFHDEGATALVCDQKKKILQETPVSPAEKSQTIRRGRFTLDADGNLDGEVEVSFTGHPAIEEKVAAAEKTDDQVDHDYREGIVQRIATAEIHDMKWTNLRTLGFPVTVSYKVHVPGYAEQAGKRLVVVPNYFMDGTHAEFTADTRKWPIFFSYPHEVHDDIELVWPENFDLDHPSAPASVAYDENTIGARYRIALKSSKHTVSYKRDYVLAGNGAIGFRSESYPVLKKRFADINRSDLHSLVFKPNVVEPPPQSAEPATEATSPASPEKPATGEPPATTAEPARSAEAKPKSDHTP